MASLSGAGVVSATCVSISGVGNGNGCFSSPNSVAVGVGTNAHAFANGQFDRSIAVGDNSTAQTNAGNFNVALAVGTGAGAAAPTGNFNTAAAVGTDAFAQSFGTANTAIALGTKAIANSEGYGNIAAAVGNPGANVGFSVPPSVGQSPSPNRSTGVFAAGTFNRAFAFGDGSVAVSIGGPITGAPTPIGNNTAISLGNGADSYAGTIPSALGTNSPNNQFAFAGPAKTAVNTVNA